MRNHRVSALVVDQEDSHCYVVIRGRPEMSHEGANDLISALSIKYDDRPSVETSKTPRVKVSIIADHVVEYGS